MFSFSWDWYNWLALLAGGGIITWVALAILAPSALQVAASWLSALSPLIHGVASGVVWFFNTMWSGFKDMADNAASIVFVVVVVLAGMWYMRLPADCTPQINQLRKEYAFVPRAEYEKLKAAAKSKGTVSKPVSKPKPKPKPKPAEPEAKDPNWFLWPQFN